MHAPIFKKTKWLLKAYLRWYSPVLVVVAVSQLGTAIASCMIILGDYGYRG
jgi:hypothetical protein